MDTVHRFTECERKAPFRWSGPQTSSRLVRVMTSLMQFCAPCCSVDWLCLLNRMPIFHSHIVSRRPNLKMALVHPRGVLILFHYSTAPFPILWMCGCHVWAVLPDRGRVNELWRVVFRYMYRAGILKYELGLKYVCFVFCVMEVSMPLLIFNLLSSEYS